MAHQSTGKPHEDGSEQFIKLLREMEAMHKEKVAQYSFGAEPFTNFRTATIWGIRPIQGVLLRMTDKWERLKSEIRRWPTYDASVDEGGLDVQIDTLMDLASYSLIAICLLLEEHIAAEEQER